MIMVLTSYRFSNWVDDGDDDKWTSNILFFLSFFLSTTITRHRFPFRISHSQGNFSSMNHWTWSFSHADSITFCCPRLDWLTSTTRSSWSSQMSSREYEDQKMPFFRFIFNERGQERRRQRAREQIECLFFVLVESERERDERELHKRDSFSISGC